MIYAKALKKTIEEGGKPKDVDLVMKHIFNQTYESILGFWDHIDANGNAEGNYTLLALNYSETIINNLKSKSDYFKFKMDPVGIFKNIDNSDLPILNLYSKINWLSGRIPSDELKCGWFDQCGFFKSYLALSLIVVIFITIFILSYFLLSHFRYEIKLESKLWKVDFCEVIVLNIKKNQTNQDVKNAIKVNNIKIILFFLIL